MTFRTLLYVGYGPFTRVKRFTPEHVIFLAVDQFFGRCRTTAAGRAEP